jgi:Protein of unknown function (DUF3572)
VSETIHDTAAAVALSALGWILSEDARVGRFLALTGLEPDDLRTRLADPALLDATFAFLESHQPDLIACAAALHIKPDALITARGQLNL